MASKSIDIVISTVLKKTGIDAARAAISKLAKNTFNSLHKIKAGFDLASMAVSKFASALSKGMEFERMTVRFKALTGSLETAKAHMKDLQDLGRTPPFSLEEFASASQMMMKMTGGMAGFKKEMEIVGDIAAATGNDIATVGRAFGLAYQVIRDGQSFGRAGQQLYMMGVLTKKQVAEFDALSQSGASNIEVWQKLSEVLGRYKGAMADTEKTTKGLIEAIQGEATVAITDFSTALSESAKPALEGLLGWMKKINDDGTIEEWADRTVRTLGEVGKVARSVGNAFGWFWKTMKTIGAKPVAFAQGLKVADEMGLKGDEKIQFARKVQKDVVDEIWNRSQDEEDFRASIAERKKAQRKKEKAKVDAEAERRSKEGQEAAQAETDRKKAEEKAKAESEAAKKAEAERLKAVEAENKAREKMESDLHKQRIDNLNAEIKAQQTKAASTESIAQAAQTEFDKAFSMYRSEDKGASQIEEERAYANDYKKLQKDASRYGGKWRIDELSSLIAAGDTNGQAAKLEEWRKSSRFTPAVESMVRAAAADKTKTTAEDELRKISKNTEDLGKKLEELLSMKG